MAATSKAVATWVFPVPVPPTRISGGRQLFDLRLRQRGFGPFDAGQVAVRGEARGFELIAQAADLTIGEFGLDQPVHPGLGLHRPCGPSASSSFHAAAMP